MGNKQYAPVAAKARKGPHDAILRLFVKAGERFVAHEVIRVRRKGAGNDHPLPLAPGKLVGVAASEAPVKAHFFKEAFRLLPHFRAPRRRVIPQRFRKYVFRRHARVKGPACVLEYHLHLFPKRSE
jgi:hypothetical protein